ncbi:uncharacterized protein [Bactrocera oleae]|uniref:uncharacterized protein n=1 Tax=Bactrocera oleae TaxID=104688 RepID=UPI00387EDA55
MSDVERARNATKTTANTASTTATAKTTTTAIERITANSEQLQYKHSSTTATTPGAAAAAAVKLQHQQLYHNQLYHQQQQQQVYSKPTTHYNYNNSATVAQQQPQYQLITSAGGEFGGGAADDTSIFGSCFGLLLKVFFSPPGLVALVVGYSMLGACIFPLLEAPQDINTSAAIAKSREECLRELWIITEKLNVLYERNWSTLVHEQLRRFEDSIVAATRHTNNSSYSIGMFGGSSTALRRYGSTFDASTDVMLAPTHWTFGEALLYSVTVITTIGHGSLTPRTAAGKIATILYALIGVPLMLMCLSSLGALLAEALQCTYARICCRLSRHQHHQHHTHQHSQPHNHHHHQQHKHEKGHREKEKQPPPHDLYQQQTHHLQVTGEKSGHLLEASAGTIGVSSGGVSKYARRCSADSLDNDVLLKRGLNGCQQEKGHELDCKNCKYDALITETNLSSGYDYSNSGNIGDPVDDSCRLLHNSPAKLNQNQMLTGAKINAHYYQQQQQQQQPQLQQQQQRPDVMLMATTATAAPKSIQQQYQQLYSRSATPSPQHFQQQQQQPQSQQQHTMQTFHIVSAGSSPTQQGQQQQLQTMPTLRQYATLQTHQHKPQQQQQYVAVPSGALVRFQTTTTTPAATGIASALSGSGNNCTTDGNGNVGIGVGATLIATGMSGNCYQSANVSVPGGGTATATIYFPIATAAHPQQQQQQQQPSSYTSVATAAATTANNDATIATTMSGAGLGSVSSSATTTQLLCNQPIVKYHTIQLTHATSKQQQQQQPALLGSAADVMPLPPPPAYQTATVHGIRRAKFLTKPLPPEISTLVAGERDLTCRHDLLLQQSSASSASSYVNNATTIPTQSTMYAGTTTTATSNASNATTIAMLTAGLTATAAACSGNPPTTTAAATANNTQMGALMSGTSSMVGSNATVDIMEDEEEHEQQRLGNCLHGTPSRVPLISGSSGAINAHSTNGSTDEEQRGARSLFNATAASFHRHTLNTFQRNAAARKSTTYAATRRAGCNMHATSQRSGKASSCYGDTATETSDDEDVEAAYMQRDATTGEQFRLTKLSKSNKQTKSDEQTAYCDTDATADETEDDEAASNADAETEEAGAQVPISIVLLILICYICLGTVIFAFWENWSIVDGAYFCFVTLTTIGYGDFMPERTFHGPHVQLFACCAYLLLGLVLVAMSFSILETQLMWKCKRIAVRLKLAND